MKLFVWFSCGNQGLKDGSPRDLFPTPRMESHVGKRCGLSWEDAVKYTQERVWACGGEGGALRFEVVWIVYNVNRPQFA